ncbi:MAG: 50S ribosomal protein L3 [Candidatus Staskawiczbacteria bacterium]|nr:50S ribosomal protein L3 [Candidatus Staskawiczbacteria bacterium]MBI3337586.1 50S ribosomal protein L3 [Candidatus Staskawiczbacteria bacterium]
MKFILGQKIGMTQIFDNDGKVIPVTLILGGPCYVLQKKRDGYESIQVGMKRLEKKNKIKKSMKGKEYKFVKEFKGDIDISKYNTGDEINVSIFNEGDKIKVSGISKGKGFQGGVKRHGFSGRNATHGVKHEQRTIGSTGSRFPQRVIKGRRMPGRMGYERVSVKNLKIAKIDKENNLLAVKGAIPGHRGTLLEIRG